MECTLHLECTWSGIGVCFYWWVIWLSPWSGILVYTYDIRSVVGVYTPVGVATEWLWSVHSKLECTLRQGKGPYPYTHKYDMYVYVIMYEYMSWFIIERIGNIIIWYGTNGFISFKIITVTSQEHHDAPKYR